MCFGVMYITLLFSVGLSFQHICSIIIKSFEIVTSIDSKRKSNVVIESPMLTYLDCRHPLAQKTCVKMDDVITIVHRTKLISTVWLDETVTDDNFKPR